MEQGLIEWAKATGYYQSLLAGVVEGAKFSIAVCQYGFVFAAILILSGMAMFGVAIHRDDESWGAGGVIVAAGGILLAVILIFTYHGAITSLAAPDAAVIKQLLSNVMR